MDQILDDINNNTKQMYRARSTSCNNNQSNSRSSNPTPGAPILPIGFRNMPDLDVDSLLNRIHQAMIEQRAKRRA